MFYYDKVNKDNRAFVVFDQMYLYQIKLLKYILSLLPILIVRSMELQKCKKLNAVEHTYRSAFSLILWFSNIQT